MDLWTAYREGAFGSSSRPWLGYVFLLEDCAKSRVPVRVSEPHFDVLTEFREASYATRYELLCRKLVLERHYESAAFLLSPRTRAGGRFSEPAKDLTFRRFAASLAGHVSAFVAVHGREGNGRS